MTLIIASICSLLCVILNPFHALIVYYTSLIWYPSSNTVQLATLDFSVSRIVCCVLFIRVLMNKKLMRGFNIIALDKCMIAYFACQIISGIFTTDFTTLVINRSGFFFDVFIPFILIRVLITDRYALEKFIKVVIFVTAPLAVFGLVEAITGNNYLLFGRDVASIDPRWGLKRAMASFGHPIYFGVFLSMVFGLGLSILPRFPKVTGSLCIIILSGVFASMSSGGWLCAITMIGIVCLYKLRHNWKQMFMGVLIMCLVVEMLSNRHFYDIIDRFALNPQTAWYRTRLIEVALFEGGMSGHWLFGYGYGNDPMWGSKIDGRDDTDMVNHYLLILSQFGLLGFIPFVGLIWYSLNNIYNNMSSLSNKVVIWQRWCLGATLLGLFFTINSVSLFGQACNFMFILFALSSSCLSANRKRLIGVQY